jgi:hypothetical protein
MAHGPPGGLPVHGDGVELDRLQHIEHLLLLGLGEEVGLVHQPMGLG